MEEKNSCLVIELELQTFGMDASIQTGSTIQAMHTEMKFGKKL